MLFRRKTKTELAPAAKTASVSSWFSTHAFDSEAKVFPVSEYLGALPKPKVENARGAMDGWDADGFAKVFGQEQTILSGPIIGWYGAQSFISHQLAAIIS